MASSLVSLLSHLVDRILQEALANRKETNKFPYVENLGDGGVLSHPVGLGPFGASNSKALFSLLLLPSTKLLHTHHSSVCFPTEKEKMKALALVHFTPSPLHQTWNHGFYKL